MPKLQKTGSWQHWLEDDLDNNSFDAYLQILSAVLLPAVRTQRTECMTAWIQH